MFEMIKTPTANVELPYLCLIQSDNELTKLRDEIFYTCTNNSDNPVLAGYLKNFETLYGSKTVRCIVPMKYYLESSKDAKYSNIAKYLQEKHPKFNLIKHIPDYSAETAKAENDLKNELSNITALLSGTIKPASEELIKLFTKFYGSLEDYYTELAKDGMNYSHKKDIYSFFKSDLEKAKFTNGEIDNLLLRTMTERTYIPNDIDLIIKFIVYCFKTEYNLTRDTVEEELSNNGYKFDDYITNKILCAF